MFRSQSIRIALVLSGVCLLRTATFGQDDPAAAERARQAEELQRQQAERQVADQMRKDRDESIQRMNDLMSDTRADMAAKAALAEKSREKLLQLQKEQFQDAFEKFQAATRDLKVALGAGTTPKQPAQRMEKSTAIFIDFITKINKTPAKFESSEFRDMTPKELGSETLTTAEHVTPSVAALLATESQDSVDIGFLTSLSKLESELRRLKWMAQKLQQSH
jgi:hypothetical protein